MKIKKLLKKAAGILLVVLGVIGLFLPVLQGMLMILLGLLLMENKTAIELFNNIKKKFKKNA